jgi:uncharacterized damage-inducible protein DinB
MKKPAKGDYSEYFETYFKNINDENPIELMESQKIEMLNLLSTVNEKEANYSYAEGKWSIKQVLGHIVDSERVFCYRAMAIARGEEQSLPGFEQDDYVSAGNFNSRELSDLLDEYKKVREATIPLFKSFDEKIYGRRGVSNGSPLTVRAAMFIIPGHEKHHLNILKERYLKK